MKQQRHQRISKLGKPFQAGSEPARLPKQVGEWKPYEGNFIYRSIQGDAINDLLNRGVIFSKQYNEYTSWSSMLPPSAGWLIVKAKAPKGISKEKIYEEGHIYQNEHEVGVFGAVPKESIVAFGMAYPKSYLQYKYPEQFAGIMKFAIENNIPVMKSSSGRFTSGREEKPKVSTNTTCQICGRKVEASTGKIAHHGYKRPGGGWQTASCMGARGLPYEQSCDLLPPTIKRIGEYISQQEKRLKDFSANPPETLTYQAGSAWHKETKQVSRPEGFDPKNDRGGWGLHQRYESEYFHQKYIIEREIKFAKSDLAFMKKRLADWVPPKRTDLITPVLGFFPEKYRETIEGTEIKEGVPDDLKGHPSSHELIEGISHKQFKERYQVPAATYGGTPIYVDSALMAEGNSNEIIAHELAHIIFSSFIKRPRDKEALREWMDYQEVFADQVGLSVANGEKIDQKYIDEYLGEAKKIFG